MLESVCRERQEANNGRLKMELPSLQGHMRTDSIPTVMSVDASTLSEEWQQNCVSQGTDVVLDPSRSQSHGV